MPLYITGSQDGSVQMWEWGHQQAVCTPRPPGTFAKGKYSSRHHRSCVKFNNLIFFSNTLSILAAWK